MPRPRPLLPPLPRPRTLLLPRRQPRRLSMQRITISIMLLPKPRRIIIITRKRRLTPALRQRPLRHLPLRLRLRPMPAQAINT